MSEPTYPDVFVHLSSGVDGNVFSVIAAVRRAIQREIGYDQSQEFVVEATSCHSYDEVLQLIMRTVKVI